LRRKREKTPDWGKRRARRVTTPGGNNLEAAKKRSITIRRRTNYESGEGKEKKRVFLKRQVGHWERRKNR